MSQDAGMFTAVGPYLFEIARVPHWPHPFCCYDVRKRVCEHLLGHEVQKGNGGGIVDLIDVQETIEGSRKSTVPT